MPMLVLCRSRNNLGFLLATFPLFHFPRFFSHIDISVWICHLCFSSLVVSNIKIRDSRNVLQHVEQRREYFMSSDTKKLTFTHSHMGVVHSVYGEKGVHETLLILYIILLIVYLKILIL